MRIKVDLLTNKERITIYMANHKKESFIIVNGKDSSYNPDLFQFKIVNMSRNWPESLKGEQVLDGANYRVAIKNDGWKKVFEFYNKFPDNIGELSQLIYEVINYNEESSR